MLLLLQGRQPGRSSCGPAQQPLQNPWVDHKSSPVVVQEEALGIVAEILVDFGAPEY